MAVVHDWLTGMRGGEKVLEEILDLYPQAEIFTLLYQKGKLSLKIESRKIHTSFIQNLPFTKNGHQRYLPFFPMAIEQMNVMNFDLVISTSHCAAKGVITPANCPHICYCHTPMRYAWDMYDKYFKRSLPFTLIFNYLRQWDVVSASRVDHFIANSAYVAARIKKTYRREATVIHPPVDLDAFPLSVNNKGYYLIVSALTPYKNIDLAIKAFNENGLPLKIVGQGAELTRLKKLAMSNIAFLGPVNNNMLVPIYQNCIALIFPQEEDFGITAVEAQACGKGVIALGRGGALETVIAKKTGCFFDEETVKSLLGAVDEFSKLRIDPKVCRQNALKYSRKNFSVRMKKFIQSALSH